MKYSHTNAKETLTSKLELSLDKEFGAGWFGRLLDTGKVEVVSSDEAARIINIEVKYGKKGALPSTITVNGIERSTLNSNGQPLAQTEAGIRNFWDWFGASKVVDDQGRPLVVYHGSNEVIDVFDKEKIGNNYTPMYGGGFYFADSYRGVVEYGSVIQPHYLRINNLSRSSLALKSDASIGGFEDVSEYAKSIDIDGLFHGDKFNKQYIAFEPNQIKSADSNSGAFDPASPNIRYSKKGTVVAFYNPITSMTYFVADNIDKDVSSSELKGLALHEIGVHALKLGKSDTEFQVILEHLEKMRATSSKIRKAFDRVPADTEAEAIAEEALAYLIQDNPDLPVAQKFLSWFRTKIRVIGNALPVLEQSKFVRWANDLTEKDLIYMATSALRKAPESLNGLRKATDGKDMLASKDAQRFYSALKKAFVLAPEKMFGNAAQVKSWLAGNASKFGIKNDEIYWSGINEWLDLQTGRVTREDVLAFMDQNGVQVEDVVLEGEPDTTRSKKLWKDANAALSEFGAAMRKGELPITINDRPLFDDDIIYEIEEGLIKPSDLPSDLALLATKWLSLTTLAEANKPVDRVETLVQERYDRPFGQLLTHEQHEILADVKNREPKHKTSALTLPGGTDYRELVVTIPTAEKFKESDTTHFGDTGKGKQIAWVRYNTRTDAEGNEGVFLEEVQSQRGQEGRRRGFVAPLSVAEKNRKLRIEARLSEVMPQYKNLERLAKKAEEIGDSPVLADIHEQMTGLASEIDNLNFELRKLLNETRVPPAPFVTDSNNKATNAYITLLIKKVVSHAIDNGQSFVAWTTGDQQSDRYDLNKQVESVTAWEKYGLYTIDIAVRGNSESVKYTDQAPDQLEAIVGKDLAKKIINNEGEKLPRSNPRIIPKYFYEGSSLKMGGEWTQAMYGNEQGLDTNGKPSLLTQAANELARKFGGKLGSVTLGTGDQMALFITPEMRKKIISEGMPLFSLRAIKDQGYDGIVYRNRYEGDKASVSYMVLDASQIKSAIGNSGVFNSDNADIRYSITPKNDPQNEVLEDDEDEFSFTHNLS